MDPLAISERDDRAKKAPYIPHSIDFGDKEGEARYCDGKRKEKEEEGSKVLYDNRG